MRKRHDIELAAPIAALLLCATVTACDYSSPAQSTGAGGGGGGGDGGTAGSAGSAGSGGGGGAGGGMTIPACSAEQGMVALEGWPWFGFEKALPDPKPELNSGAPATIVAVELGWLSMTFDGAAVDSRLGWVGPDLNEVFTAGDMVTVTMDAGLQAYRVAGAKGQAVVLRYANAEVPQALPAIPGGGPNLSIEVECAHEEKKMCDAPDRRTLYTLTASLAAGSTKIPSGMTGQVGTWKIRHIKSMNLELHSGAECTLMKFFDGAVHALEVKP
ncbi:MAG: hypothetical protein IPM54_18400 [Polyangiaceae bacterium]|nr:hypothetical protein [Polyangiaceae bacterium]